MNPVTSIDPLAPIQALPNLAPLAQVADALQSAFATIRAHVHGALAREVVQRGIIELLEAKRIDGATRLVQLAAAESRAVEEKDAPAVTKGGGTPLALLDPDPWPNPVDGAAWLDEVVALLREYLILPDQAAEAIALWIMQTYTLEAANVSPILAVCSPEKRCGKTRLLTMLHLLCRRGLPASNVTGAAVYRTIEQYSPTFLIDEADSFIAGNDELRGIINAGHTRGAFIVRTVGDDHTARVFSTWSAKAIAKIGGLTGRWETAADRAILVRMKRRAPYETVTRSFPKKTDQTARLQQQAIRWSSDNLDSLRAAQVQPSRGLDDRAEDNWAPLFAIAQTAGSGWLEKATTAALALSGAAERESKSPGLLLLEDIRKYFSPEGPGVDKVATVDLVEWLVKSPDLSDRSWGTFRQGKPISTTRVGSLLEQYGIKPDRWWEGTRPARTRVRGFQREAFMDAWERYLGSAPKPEEVAPTELDQAA